MRPAPFATWRGLPGPVYTLLVVRIVESSGSFVQPFLALLLSQSLGFTTAQTGLFLTLNSVAMVPGSLWGGRLVDRWGRKRVLMLARLATAAFLVPCALLEGHLAVAFLLVGASVAASFGFSAVPAILTDLTPAPQRSDGFSLLYLGHNLGFALGTTVAGFLFTHARPWLFWGETLMIGLSVALVFFQVPETRPAPDAEAEGNEAAHAGGLFSALVSRPLLLAFAGLMALVWLAYSQVWFGAPLWLTAVHGSEAGPPLYGLLMAATAVMVLAVTPPLSRLARGRSPALTIGLGALLMGVGFFGFLGAGWVPLLFVAGLVLTVGEVLWATGAPAYVANHSPVSHRGRFQSGLNVIQNTGSMAGPWLGGVVSGVWGLVVLWPLALGVMVLAAGGLVVLHRRETKGVRPEGRGPDVLN